MFELDDETRWILGRPNFMCAPIARQLRAKGHVIAEKAEDEQAVAIHWMLCLHEEHGASWRDHANAYLKAETDPSPGEGG
jgi:hypothetical protein